MSYANMVKTYGEAELSFASYYNYSSAQLKNDKVESVTFTLKVYSSGDMDAEDLVNKEFTVTP